MDIIMSRINQMRGILGKMAEKHHGKKQLKKTDKVSY